MWQCKNIKMLWKFVRENNKIIKTTTAKMEAVLDTLKIGQKHSPFSQK
jgi:hypothetical protein